MSIRTVTFALWVATLLIIVNPIHAADIKMTAIEDALEGDTTTVMLPTLDTGTVLIRNCNECNSEPLRLTKDSKFYVGAAETTLQQLNDLLHSRKGGSSMTVFYIPATRAVTRILIPR